MQVYLTSFFNDLFGGASWVLPGTGLLLAFPILTVIIGEISNRLWQAGHEPLARAFFFIRNVALPLLFIDMMLRIVAGFQADHIAIKLTDTLVGIAGINVIVSFFNALVFSEGGVAAKRGIPKLFLDLLRLFLVALGAAFVISFVWDVNLGAMLTALGIGSVVLGLALQDTLGSLFTGLAMLSARNFKKGDWIKVGTREGIVKSMNWRTMVIQTRSGDDAVLPNLMLANQEVTKFLSDDEWHIVTLEFELSFDHPPEMVKKLLEEAASATPGVLQDPPPEGRLLKYADHAVVYQIRLWVADYAPVPVIKSDYHCVFWYLAKRNRLIFPGRYHRFYRPPEKLLPPSFEDIDRLTDLLLETKAIPRKREILRTLLEQATHVTYRENEVVLHQGEVASHLYIITRGRVSVDYEPGDEFDQGKDRGKHAADKNNGGGMVHLQTHEEGQFIVFKTLFNNGPTPFSVRADTDFEAIAIPVAALESFLSDDPQLAHEIQEIISSREEAAERILRETVPDYEDKTSSSDRIQIMKNMFPDAAANS